MGVHRNTLGKWLIYEQGEDGGRKPRNSALRLASLFTYFFEENHETFDYLVEELSHSVTSDNNQVRALLSKLGNKTSLVSKIMNENNRTILRWVASGDLQGYSTNYARKPSSTTNQLALVACYLLKNPHSNKRKIL
ncbi:MAG: hypothetical protein ACI9FB_003819 [Candidatus Azotimanducaceae bacterium]|jgi:hypothetical protein